MSRVARDPNDEAAWRAHYQALCLRVEAARETHGLSQEDLASASGLSHGTVGNLETPRTTKDGAPGSPELRSLFRVAAALGLRPVDLLPALAEVPSTDPRAPVDVSYPREDGFVDYVRAHPLPQHTEQARRRRRRAP